MFKGILNSSSLLKNQENFTKISCFTSKLRRPGCSGHSGHLGVQHLPPVHRRVLTSSTQRLPPTIVLFPHHSVTCLALVLTHWEFTWKHCLLSPTLLALPPPPPCPLPMDRGFAFSVVRKSRAKRNATENLPIRHQQNLIYGWLVFNSYSERTRLSFRQAPSAQTLRAVLWLAMANQCSGMVINHPKA